MYEIQKSNKCKVQVQTNIICNNYNHDFRGGSILGHIASAFAAENLTEKQKDIKDFTDTARSLVLGATALIPYVGSFISPIIGLLWPANVGTAMTAQTKTLVALINEQFADYDIETLEQKRKILKNLMSRLDDLQNNKPLTFGEQGTIQ